MQNVMISTLSLVAVLSTPTFASDFDKQAWSDELNHEFSALRTEAVLKISNQNLAELKANDESVVKVIKQQQEALASVVQHSEITDKS